MFDTAENDCVAAGDDDDDVSVSTPICWLKSIKFLQKNRMAERNDSPLIIVRAVGVVIVGGSQVGQLQRVVRCVESIDTDTALAWMAARSAPLRWILDLGDLFERVAVNIRRNSRKIRYTQ